MLSSLASVGACKGFCRVDIPEWVAGVGLAMAVLREVFRDECRLIRLEASGGMEARYSSPTCWFVLPLTSQYHESSAISQWQDTSAPASMHRKRSGLWVCEVCVIFEGQYAVCRIPSLSPPPTLPGTTSTCRRACRAATRPQAAGSSPARCTVYHHAELQSFMAAESGEGFIACVCVRLSSTP